MSTAFKQNEKQNISDTGQECLDRKIQQTPSVHNLGTTFDFIFRNKTLHKSDCDLMFCKTRTYLLEEFILVLDPKSLVAIIVKK